MVNFFVAITKSDKFLNYFSGACSIHTEFFCLSDAFKILNIFGMLMSSPIANSYIIEDVFTSITPFSSSLFTLSQIASRVHFHDQNYQTGTYF